ncbi:unnamed protein product, partial [Staurois parvus]
MSCQSAPGHNPAIRLTDGTIFSDPRIINQTYAQFYETLYSDLGAPAEYFFAG